MTSLTHLFWGSPGSVATGREDRLRRWSNTWSKSFKLDPSWALKSATCSPWPTRTRLQILFLQSFLALFPTCQVRVVRFYQSCSPPPPPPPPPPHPPPPPRSPDVGTAGPPPRAPDPSGHCRTSTASCRSQWALPDLNRGFQVAVGTAGLQPRLPDRSGHCRISTASSRSQWALPDLNRDFQIALGTAGPQREECQKRCQIEC